VTECFAEAARLEAAAADVVVTNHTLLALHATSGRPILPNADLVIVDEAHQLTDTVTSALTATLGAPAVERAARAGALAKIETTALEQDAARLGACLALLPLGRLPSGPPQALIDAAAMVQAEARVCLRALSGSKANEALTLQANARLTDLVEVCGGIVQCSSDDVLWLEADDDATNPALHLAPLSVAETIRRSILGMATTVMTSATLSLGDNFESIARSAGLDQPADGDAEALEWRSIDVGSPFDYPNQGICYIAADLPPPARDGTPASQFDVLEQLIRAAGGGTLGLFTSRAAAIRAADELRQRLDLPILVQGEQALAALVERFSEEEDTCLFGTVSLWQGVDAPGRTCRLVTIDRIPFPRPDDPVRSARSEAAEKAGRSGFMAVSVAQAALMLAQGAGRLIRRDTDRGVVAILDPRLATKSYGAILRRALPPLWTTTDLDRTCKALERLREGTEPDHT
jgi:ATP-dependent DNA helicase DinG